ncbi:MAG: hypothetical protein FD143_3647 [Ignavibacteria bacterium]|nr:MAG: hypothetical protein FD143_3647 [Ignavibacteria bacterium]
MACIYLGYILDNREKAERGKFDASKVSKFQVSRKLEARHTRCARKFFLYLCLLENWKLVKPCADEPIPYAASLFYSSFPIKIFIKTDTY